MRNFQTTVLDTFRDVSGPYATEPFEAGWAQEATFFVRVHRTDEGTRSVPVAVQVSVDGLSWVDEGTHANVPTDRDGFVRVRHFGGWLRLMVDVPPEVSCNLSIWIVLKE